MEDFLVVPSKSRYEILMREHDYSHESVMKELVFDDVRKNVVDGHNAQKNNLQYLKSVFGESHILADRGLLTSDLAKKYNFIVAAGGDEHFCWVSHKIDDVPVLGYVLDSRRSVGALLYFSKDNLEKNLQKLVAKDYQLEHWTKIAVAINESPLEQAISFYSFSETDSDDNSRQMILFRGKSYDYRVSSGVHVTTGAGSSSWYKQLHRDVFSIEDRFGKEERLLKVFLREIGGKENRKFEIYDGEELQIVSYYDSQGKARPDAIKEMTYPFNIGYIAKVRVADESLKVVKPQSL